jgi:preprotein translocase SecF subunit
MQFFKNTHIDFIGKRKYFYVLSLTITVLGLVVAFTRGVKFGIDFEGGTEAAFAFSKNVETDQIRSAVEAGGFQGAEIKTYGETNQFLIRVKRDAAEKGGQVSQAEGIQKLSDRLKGSLEKAFPGMRITLLKVDNIGPKIGKELRTKAIYAVLASIVAILLYIAFRFEWVYGLGAVIALVHDVLVAFAAAVIFNGLFGLNLEMNQGQLAAFLTVVGFSINDTVIIFDRIRENKNIHRGENLLMLMNRSINETLPRTINTALTVVLVLLIMVVFAGDVLQGFAFTMLVGIITGTYSSIYIASAFVVDTMIKRKHLDAHAERDFVTKRDRELAEKRAASAAIGAKAKARAI